MQDDIYEVERAVAKRVVKVSNPSSCAYTIQHVNFFEFEGEEQMLVTWTGFPVHTASWVPSTHVTPSVLRLASYCFYLVK